MSTDFDLAVIGGGIHGAALANYAAQSGIKVILFEKNDFASGTSSRSSKMAHGGLRYLELFDFQQVFEGIKAREELYQQAGSICTPQPFFIPVAENDYYFRLKLSAGLFLYDFFQKNSQRQHKFIPINESRIEAIRYRQKLMGYFQYFDGILNDTELVFAHLNQALEYGAEVYNYSEVQKLTSADSCTRIEYLDKRSQKLLSIKSRAVINVAGIYTAELLNNNKLNAWPLRFSRGSHILFNKKWNHPALFLPLNSKARYYFVWPHFAGTLVGTTEREVTELTEDPQAEIDELKEIFTNIRKDLPASGLTAEIAHYAFAGLRVLPARNNKATGQMSRRHIWQKSGNVLSLFGGKLTTAGLTALEGLRLLYGQGIKLKNFKLDSVFREQDSLENRIALAINRYKAQSLNDLMQRRLYLEYLPDNGFSQLEQVVSLAALHGLTISPAEIEKYKNRIKQLRTNLLVAGEQN